MLILSFQDYAHQATNLAEALGVPLQFVDVHYFPDGECRVRVPTPLPSRVIICRSLDRPNSKLIELLLTAAAAREAGATRLELVAPYLCYMRQDMAFQAGEAVSQRVIGAWLGHQYDAVITVDPHLHRIHDLGQAISNAETVALRAAPLLAEFATRIETPAMVVGPDRESAQWVQGIAELAGLEHLVAEKTRHGDHAVHIALPEGDIRGRSILLVDDVVSTGTTLSVAARALRTRGAARIFCLVTHALFAPGATTRLKQAGIEQTWSTDSIDHESNAIPLAGLLAEAIARD